MVFIENCLDTCVVLHEASQLGKILAKLLELAQMTNTSLKVALMITKTGNLPLDVAKDRFSAAGVEVVYCVEVDDIFMDYSGYAEATRFFYSKSSQGVLFVNDTLVRKHNSKILRRSVSRNIKKLREQDFDFPILIGPYRHSEFSVEDNGINEFVATFLFYLNRPGLKCMTNVCQFLVQINKDLEELPVTTSQLDHDVLRFAHIHKLQLKERYLKADDGLQMINRKVTTAYAERKLSKEIKRNGIVWYAASGIIGRILIPLEIYTNRLFGRLFNLD